MVQQQQLHHQYLAPRLAVLLFSEHRHQRHSHQYLAALKLLYSVAHRHLKRLFSEVQQQLNHLSLEVLRQLKHLCLGLRRHKHLFLVVRQRRKRLYLELKQRKPPCSVHRQLRHQYLERLRKQTKRLYSVLVSSLFLAQLQHSHLFLVLQHRLIKHLFLGPLRKLPKRRCSGRRRPLRRPCSELLRLHKLQYLEVPLKRLCLERLLPQQAGRYLAAENLCLLPLTYQQPAHHHKAARAYSEEGKTILLHYLTYLKSLVNFFFM